MSNYIMHNGTFLSEDELMHWKYIKREKVGNKWKYYYDIEELKKDTKAFVKDPIGKKAKQTYQQAQKNQINAQNRISGRQMSDSNYAEASRGNMTTSSNNRAAREKARRDYTKDSVNLAVAKRNTKAAKEAYDKTLLAKLEKAGDNIRSLPDKLGVDEREKYRKAKNVYDVAKSYKDEANYKVREFEKAHKNDGYKEYPYDKSHELHRENMYWRERSETRGKEYMSARSEYFNTPIGKVAKVTTSVTDWVDDVIDDIKNKPKKNKAPTPTLSSPNETILKENVIYEDVIREDKIYEDRLTEEQIREKKLKEKKR